MEYLKRKPQRLRSWNYSNPGMYFVTFCTAGKKKLLGDVRSPSNRLFDDYRVEFTRLGEICTDAITRTCLYFDNVRIVDYVVMPNHVHLLVEIKNRNKEVKDRKDCLSRFVGIIKRLSSREAHNAGYKGTLWQRSFYDHIVRNESDLARIIEYINDNPRRWQEDRYFAD